MGDYSHLKNKKGELIAKPLPQPTLPNLSVDDDSSSMRTRVAAPSTYTQDSYYYKGDNGLNSDYPPMPAYSPYPNYQAPTPYAQYPSSATLSGDDPAYPSPHISDDDNESTVHLAEAAAPFARDPIDRQGSSYGPAHGGIYDADDVYQGRTGSTSQHRRSPPSSMGQPQGGLAYDDVPEYPGQYQHPAGMFAAPQLLDNPYSGYASPPTPVSNQPSRGRNYDEEIGYGRGQGGAHYAY